MIKYEQSKTLSLNADGQLNGGLLGNNLFAYCENNPLGLRTLESSSKSYTSHKSQLTTQNYNLTFNIVSIDTPNNHSSQNGSNETPLKQNSISFSVEHGFWNTAPPEFFKPLPTGFQILSWDLSVYSVNLYFDANKNHSIYADLGNISTYVGFDFEEGVGVDLGASVLNLGYDGRIIDFEVNFLTAELNALYKDGSLEYGMGFGFIGFGVSIDIFELYSILLQTFE